MELKERMRTLVRLTVGKRGSQTGAVPIAIGTFDEDCPDWGWAHVSVPVGLSKKLICN